MVFVFNLFRINFFYLLFPYFDLNVRKLLGSTFIRNIMLLFLSRIRKGLIFEIFMTFPPALSQHPNEAEGNKEKRKFEFPVTRLMIILSYKHYCCICNL